MIFIVAFVVTYYSGLGGYLYYNLNPKFEKKKEKKNTNSVKILPNEL